MVTLQHYEPIFCCATACKPALQFLNNTLNITLFWINTFNHCSCFREASFLQSNDDPGVFFLQFATSTKIVGKATFLAYNRHLLIDISPILTFKPCLMRVDCHDVCYMSLDAIVAACLNQLNLMNLLYHQPQTLIGIYLTVLRSSKL